MLMKLFFYVDETILLKDLIFPASSELTKSERFIADARTHSVSLKEFSESFWSIANNTKDQNFIQFLNTLNTSSDNIEKQYSIYFPYSENFNLNTFDISIISGIADTDEILGYNRIGSGSQTQYNLVKINDDVAEIKRTHIIGKNGTTLRSNTSVSTLAGFQPGPGIVTPGLPREVKQVFVGDVKCKKQYDALVSFSGNGGGSEIRFVKGDGYLSTVGGQITAVPISGPHKHTRKQIRNENWIDWTAEFDMDWEEDNHQLFLAIFEDDNRNSQEINASVGTTVKIDSSTSITGSVGVKLTFYLDDDLIHETKLNRDVFFVLNRSSTYSLCGMYDGWPKRNCYSNVEFSLLDRTLTP